MQATTFTYLKAIVFDWAGTTVDFGSCAPAAVFQEIFAERGVPITAAQAREPMGRAKRDHIATIGKMPDVDHRWRLQHTGNAMNEADIDAMYAEFLPLQKQTLDWHSKVIQGVTATVDWCRAKGLKIGSTTGYTRELLNVVRALAAEQGYTPDCALGAEDAPFGRPAPYLLYECAKQLNVYPLWHMVKVDDTPVGIQAGRNAGCWTIGISRTGNCVGLSEVEWEATSTAQRTHLLSAAEQALTAAGAHAVVESVADIRPLLEQFEKQLEAGMLPL
jgi:phosphonoacetaldehyde hydrolase